MADTTFAILGFIGVLVILIGFILYAVNTNRIIKSQEKEITKLKKQLRQQEQKEPLYIVQDGRHPKFGGF